MPETLTLEEMNQRLGVPPPVAPTVAPDTLSVDELSQRMAPAAVPLMEAPEPANVLTGEGAALVSPYRPATSGGFRRLGADIAASLGEQAAPEPAAPAAAPLVDPPPVGPIQHYAGAFGQSGAQILADVPKALAISRYGSAQNVLTQFDLIERGEKHSIGNLSAGQMGDVAEYFQYPTSREKLRFKYQTEGADPRTTGLYEAGVAFEKGARGLMPTDPAKEEEFGTKIARGFGSFGGFMVAGIGGRLVKMPVTLSTMALGGAIEGAGVFQEALGYGASLEEAYTAAKLASIAGTSEALPIVRVLDRFDKGTGGTLSRALKEGAKGGAEEGLQEFGQRIANNLIASKAVKYDPDREMFEGTGENAGIGFTVGALFNVVASMLGARTRTRRGPRETEPELKPEITPEITLEPVEEAAPATLPPEPSPPAAPTEAPIPPERPTAPVEAPAAVTAEDVAAPPPKATTQAPEAAEEPAGPAEAPAPSAPAEQDVSAKLLGEVKTYPRRGPDIVSTWTKKPPGTRLNTTENNVLTMVDEARLGPEEVTEGGRLRSTGVDLGFMSNPLIFNKIINGLSKGKRKALLSLVDRGYVRVYERASSSEAGGRTYVLDLDRTIKGDRGEMSRLQYISAVDRARSQDQAAKRKPPTPQVPPLEGVTPLGVKPKDPTARKVFRGYGRKDVATAYTDVAVAVLGKGRYYSFSQKTAETFGPKIEERDLDLNNPLTIKSDEEWRALAKEAGWPYPNLFGLSEAEIAKHTAGLKALVQKRGHDGVIVDWNDEVVGDFDDGRLIKTLRKVFGGPQVVDYRTKKIDTEATAQGEQILTPGVAPVTAKEKAEAKGRGKLRGGRDPFEGTPLGDVSGRGQGDLVDLAREKPPLAPPTELEALVKEKREIAARVERGELEATPELVEKVRGIDQKIAALQTPKEKKRRKPTKAQSLTDWLKAEGGVQEYKGELAALGITSKVRPGLINNKTGMSFDDAANAAWEAGFFPEHSERPTINEFLEVLGEDARGRKKRVTPQDEELEEYQSWVDQVVEIADRLGIKVSGRKIEDIATEIEGLPAGAYGMQVALPPRPSRVRGYEAGARYKGFRPEEKEPVEPPKSKKPLDREAVLAPLLKDLGIPIYQGRMKGRKVLGFYRPNVDEIRVKRYGDVEVAAHELAHFLDHKFPEIRKQWLPAKKANADLREELRAISYDKKKLFEGFAEFVRLWATQPAEAKKRAPLFNEWWEGWLDRSPHGKALRSAKKGFLAWFEQEGILRAKSKVGLNEDINAGLDSTSDRFRQWALDDLQGILAAETTMFGGQQELGAYETGRLARSAQSIVYGALKFGAPKMMSDGRFAFVDANGNPSAIYETDKKGRPRIKANPKYKPWGLENILKPVADNLEDFGMYAIGRRAEQLKKEGRERLFTNAEIRAMLALETPTRAKAFADWNVFNSQTLDFAQQGGVINRASRRQWETDVYLPFWRVTKQGPAGAKALGGIPGAMKLIRRLHGGTANLQDPILNMVQNTRMMIEAAIINHAKVAIVDKIAQKQGGARFLTKIPRENKAVKIDTEQVERAFWESIGVNYNMLKSGMLPAEIDPQFATLIQQGFARHGDFMQFMLRGQSPEPGSDIQAIMRDGKAHYYQVADNLLLRSMQSLPRQIKTHPMISILKGVKNLGQQSVTLALDFMARNISRDQIMASVLSRHGYKPFISAAKGLKHRLAEDAVYQEYLANGGGVATFMSTETGIYKDLERFYKKHNIAYEMVVNTPRKMLRMLQILADATEMATRLGYFEKALSKGEQPRKAAFLSRDISTDFAKRGDSQALGFLYDTVMFLKAGVVGVDRVYQGFTRDPNRAKVATATAGLALASVGLWALNYGNPLYDDLEDWAKDSFWHFFIPKPKHLETWYETGELPDIPEEELYEHFWFPKAWEIGGIASIAERTMELVVKGEGKEYAKHILKIIRDMFRFEYLPQAIKPMAEVSANRLFFFDRPIETMADEGLEPWARAGRASRSLRAVGEQITRHLPRGLQLSPAKMEALLRGYLNAWAGYGLTLSDQVFFDDSPDLRIDQYPVFKSFYRKQPRRSSRYTTEFWDMLRAATEARRTARLMIRKERPGIADELIYGKPGEAIVENLEYGRLHGAEGIMRNLIKTQRMVTDAGTLKKVQSLTEEYAKAMRQRGIIGRLKARGYWRDIGALKSELLDEIGKAKRHVAKLAVQDIKRIRKTEPMRGQKLRQETIRRYGTPLPGVR